MTEREKRDLAWRLAEGSSVFDFEKALEFVQFDPTKAEKLIRNREETRKQGEELDRTYERLHKAALEFR